jgi:hypothetical protein
MPRILLMLFNVIVFGTLVYRLIQVYQTQMERSRKRTFMITGIILLLLPVTMLLRFIPPTMLYLFLYPLAIGLFLYFTWDRRE